MNWDEIREGQGTRQESVLTRQDTPHLSPQPAQAPQPEGRAASGSETLSLHFSGVLTEKGHERLENS